MTNETQQKKGKWEVRIEGHPRDEALADTLVAGCDVIATKPGVMTIRVLDEMKAYKPGYLVEAHQVRALYDVVTADGASRGYLAISQTRALPA